MLLIKKVFLGVFLWSWLVTLPIALLGAFVSYQAWQHYQTFSVRYDPSPAVTSLSGDVLIEIGSLRRKTLSAIERYINDDWTQLETISLFASQADLSQLNSNLPHSGFQYIKAGLLENNKLIKAKIRYRGDFIPHWGKAKKSIRVKTSKGQLYQGMRVFNLLAPKFTGQLNNYYAYQLAERLGLIAPKTKLIRVILNNEDRGVHILVEQIKEITLRRHHLMPADIYRGEIHGKDNFQDIHISKLFQSASVWDKVAINNHYPPNSKKPLAYLLQLIQDQDNLEAQAELSRILDLSAWARFSVFESLTQTQHYDYLHNWRLYYDPWRQKFLPIVWDPVGWAKAWLPKHGANLEINMTTLHNALFKNGDFLRMRQQVQRDFFSTGEAAEFIKFVAKTRQKMNHEILSDPVLQPPVIQNVQRSMQSLDQSIQKVFTALETRNMTSDSRVLYQYQDAQLQLYLQDQRAIKGIRLDFDQALPDTPKATISYQEQGKEMSKDISSNLNHSSYQLQLDIELLPNLSIHDQQFTFAKSNMGTPFLGNYVIQFPDLAEQLSLLAVQIDYGQGWELAQGITNKDIVNLNIAQMQHKYTTPDYQDTQQPWQLFWNLGDGFNQKNSIVVKNSIDKSGRWIKKGALPGKIIMLRVDLPEKSSLQLSDLILHIDDMKYPIPANTLSLHSLTLKDQLIVTQNQDDPYFIINMGPYIPQGDQEKDLLIELSFQVENNLSWQDVLQQNLLPLQLDIYAPFASKSITHPLIWSGDVKIAGVQSINQPLIIRPGTRVLLAAGSSLIIKNRLLAIGTKEQPIRFIPQDKTHPPWGALVLFGAAANDSILSHCQFSAGSGLKGNLFEYTAMLSIHAVQDAYINHCTFTDNKLVDDMVHVVYSKVRFTDNVFSNAFSDALDIDISEAVIINNSFINSGNDAIDLMTTQAVVADSSLINNGDKGISVGEGSQLFAVNNRLEGNAIGIQAKDSSTALIFNQTFIGNQTALHAYKKNWRYGAGGMILTAKSQFINNQIDLEAKKHSRILLYDNYLQSELPEKRVHAWFVDDLDKSKAQQGKLPKKIRQLPAMLEAVEWVPVEQLTQKNNQLRGANFGTD
ncbi:MAG TPA: hypothetical protein EYQ43_00980 [Methyloprofundus sp.]|nr:hypothetical protein [Methyloprofundus sp.]HIL78029.1 hypothetical protein [Methylococcales bacterium]